MSAHTPGKLGIDAHNNIVSSGGKLVAFPCISDGFDQKANASRLAACWNACDGISTESLVSGTALITAFQREQDRADTAERERDSLRAVNAELLAALERIDGMACYASEENTDAKDDVLLMIGTHARAAIARATDQADRALLENKS